MTDNNGTNGYSTDRKMIEYRLDQTDAKLGHVETALTSLAVDVRELKTTMTASASNAGRWSGAIAAGVVSVVVAIVVWVIKGQQLNP